VKTELCITDKNQSRFSIETQKNDVMLHYVTYSCCISHVLQPSCYLCL